MKRKAREVKRKVKAILQPTLTQAERDERAELKALAKSINDAIQGKGFALFILYGDKPMYLSNANRGDVVLALREWLEKIPEDAVMVESGSKRPLSDDPDPFQGYERIRLEKLCVQVAAILEVKNDIVLFLFDLGDAGNMAFKTNVPHARKSVQMWVDTQP